MKTPKRTIPCPKCGAPCELGISVIESWDERYEVPALFCTHTGEEVVGNAKAICSRLIRKNREARLRSKIKKEIWKHERDEAKHNEFIRFINDSARLLHDLVPMSGAYGQDVEGS